MLVIRRIRWRRIWKWAIFFMLWREGRPMTSVARVLKHTAVIVVAVMELIKYRVTSLKILAGALYR